MASSSSTASPKPASPRIHVLGLGSIGCFAAHCITEIPGGPSITLLLHRKSLLDAYRQNGNRMLVQTPEGKHISSEGYSFEVLENKDQWYHTSPDDVSDTVREPASESIENLIVCVKATQTVEALRPLVRRLGPTSTILFLQNGSGMIEEVNAHLFTSPEMRPRYLVGVISHGVTLNSSFDITHTGFSATSIGPMPREGEKLSSRPDIQPDIQPDGSSNDNENYLLQTLPHSPRLNLTSYTYTSVLQFQLEKLAVNAFCNPLCALNDAPNGFLFTIPDTRRAILTEISKVVLALPELADVPGVAERFSVQKLEETVNGILTKTYNTTSSMVWDLRAGRETEVRFINGSWSRMGRTVGVETPVNDSTYEDVLAGKEPTSDDLALLFAIFAGAALVLTPDLLETMTETGLEVQGAFKRYTQIALAILIHQSEPPTPSTRSLQAMTTLSYVLSYTEEFVEQSRELQFRGLLMARSMQIHRLDTNRNSQDRSLKGFDAVEVEVQRRIWWHIVLNDWLSSFWGGPRECTYMIHPGHMTVNPPTELDDEKATSPPTQGSPPLDILTPVFFLLTRIRLAQICRQAVDTITSDLDDPQELESLERSSEVIAKIHGEFQAFIEGLPSILKVDAESLQQSHELCEKHPWIAWQRAMLHFAVNTRMHRLHRSSYIEDSAHLPSRDFQRICSQAAQMVLIQYSSMESIGKEAGLIRPSKFWLITQTAIPAIALLAADILHHPQEDRRIIEALSACRLLDEAQQGSAALQETIREMTPTLIQFLRHWRATSGLQTELESNPSGSWTQLWSLLFANAAEMDASQWSAFLKDAGFL
ncbi:2-dehydropantoate 2-reductase (Ketopantoate reductase) (KPA reductase) (KPR) [Aspergillus melleus]|uniref:2-dehydropantoate 2-reductase (Ketopantoate reductase) (KPA reductase) (KPR) n=1 Tax=Aspergillus melleus TaxID=138277 RepID=A0ACC3AM41_9EURO|nr:2-dehydropantoate 2-reductase (Ketopantoate reductase) (KPA reductase) (KPR) [Aspergillus melleus]